MAKQICMNCKIVNEEDAKFCKECGGTSFTDLTEERSAEDDSADIETNETNESNESIPPKSRKKTWLLIPVVLAVIVIVVIAGTIGSRPKLVSIAAKYTGDTEAGTMLDADNTGIVVTGRLEDGQTVDLSGWKVTEPAELNIDETEKIEITYRDFSCTLTVICSTSEVTAIEASYEGDTSAGVVIDDKAPITVYEVHKNGSRDRTSEWHIDQPFTLEADSTAEIHVISGDYTTALTIECSTITLVGLEASYDGDTEEGTVLDNSNKGIHVTASYQNGTKKEIKDYTVAESSTLTAGETSVVTIQYEGMECELSVECTTITPEQFKALCESVPYEKLARNPDEYEAKMVKFTGEVAQVIEGSKMSALRVNVTKGKYYYTDTVYVMYEPDASNRILEDDIVTFYGYSMGLYTYETIMGASVTIPEVLAMYVDIN